jgi:hypothetical protein
MSTMHYVCAALATALLALGVTFLAYRRRVDRLVEEGNRRVEEAIGNPLLTGINIGNGTIDIGMEGPGPVLLAGMFLGMFEKHPDAKNYIECRMTSSKGDVFVTVRKADGKSPDTLRREAEQKLAALQTLTQPIESEFVRLEDLPGWIRKMQDEVRAARATQGEQP